MLVDAANFKQNRRRASNFILGHCEIAHRGASRNNPRRPYSTAICLHLIISHEISFHVRVGALGMTGSGCGLGLILVEFIKPLIIAL